MIQSSFLCWEKKLFGECIGNVLYFGGFLKQNQVLVVSHCNRAKPLRIQRTSLPGCGSFADAVYSILQQVPNKVSDHVLDSDDRPSISKSFGKQKCPACLFRSVEPCEVSGCSDWPGQQTKLTGPSLYTARTEVLSLPWVPENCIFCKRWLFSNVFDTTDFTRFIYNDISISAIANLSCCSYLSSYLQHCDPWSLLIYRTKKPLCCLHRHEEKKGIEFCTGPTGLL